MRPSPLPRFGCNPKTNVPPGHVSTLPSARAGKTNARRIHAGRPWVLALQGAGMLSRYLTRLAGMGSPGSLFHEHRRAAPPRGGACVRASSPSDCLDSTPPRSRLWGGTPSLEPSAGGRTARIAWSGTPPSVEGQTGPPVLPWTSRHVPSGPATPGPFHGRGCTHVARQHAASRLRLLAFPFQTRAVTHHLVCPRVRGLPRVFLPTTAASYGRRINERRRYRIS